MPTTIGIIGAVGREPGQLTNKLFMAMVSKTRWIITAKLKLALEDVVLVGGGGAWSGHLLVTSTEHVAIHLFLEHHCGLNLFFPCGFGGRLFPKFIGTEFLSDPARITNQCHERFRRVVDFDPRHEIQDATNGGAVVSIQQGFEARNAAIAGNSDVLIAFSWAESGAPVYGDAFQIWSQSTARSKIHISLHSL
ncbi:hypothetical protein BC936DRAFT_140273 [Jimgerdemannia flammicorona]|uniref:Uncharacterized protein n=1 Tax=Jimgerdemannia flammicorona TaxID=994334 RepID=A0A433DGX4_9FUNG|nr:hypothetical protein BC936DRAFT_140273 [Jimgerdemannia flammicorona]